MNEFSTAAARPVTSAPPEGASSGGARRSRIGRVLAVTIQLAACVLGVLALAGGVAYASLPAIGYEGRAVIGGSMEPAIPRGSLVIVEHVAAEDIKAGDVITFRPRDGIPTTHRVVSVREVNGALRFATKGDANDSPDPLETELPNGAGRVVLSVPLVGQLTEFGRSGSGQLLLMVAPALALAALLVANSNSTTSARRGG